MTDLYIAVGIDVKVDFSFMSIALPNQTFVGKPFRITHSNLNLLETAILKIREAEESNLLKAHIFTKYLGIFLRLQQTLLEKYPRLIQFFLQHNQALSGFHFIAKVCFAILLSKLCIFCKLHLLPIDFS